MDTIIELVKKNVELFFENVDYLCDEEIDEADIEAYYAIKGATDEELSSFEKEFQIELPEDFKALYRYKNGSGHIRLIWPRKGLYEGFCLLPLQKMRKIKSHFQNKTSELTEFYDEKDKDDKEQLSKLDERIKPHLSCVHWFPFAEYCGSIYLMLDYDPSEKGKMGQIICYVHDPDFVSYIAPDLTAALRMTEEVIDGLIYE